jgi:hypothetical protein
MPKIVCPTADGGIIVGRSLSFASNADYIVVKYNVNGNKEWDKTFSGNKQHNLNAIIQTADGGYLLGGSSNSGIFFRNTQVYQRWKHQNSNAICYAFGKYRNACCNP